MQGIAIQAVLRGRLAPPLAGVPGPSFQGMKPPGPLYDACRAAVFSTTHFAHGLARPNRRCLRGLAFAKLGSGEAASPSLQEAGPPSRGHVWLCVAFPRWRAHPILLQLGWGSSLAGCRARGRPPEKRRSQPQLGMQPTASWCMVPQIYLSFLPLVLVGSIPSSRA